MWHSTTMRTVVFVNKTYVIGGWKLMLCSTVTALRDSGTSQRRRRRRLIKICSEAVMLHNPNIYPKFWSIPDQLLLNSTFVAVSRKSLQFITLSHSTYTMTRSRMILYTLSCCLRLIEKNWWEIYVFLGKF